MASGSGDGDDTDEDKAAPPADAVADPGQGTGCGIGAQPAHGHEDAGHAGELIRFEPLCQNFHGGNEEHRRTEAHQHPGDNGRHGRLHPAQENGGESGQEKEGGDGFARAPGVGQQARGELHQGIGVEIGGRQKTEQGTVRTEVGLHFEGHHGGAEAVEIDQQVAEGQQAEHHPAIAAAVGWLRERHHDFSVLMSAAKPSCRVYRSEKKSTPQGFPC
jgi:hypothetical protein